MIQLSDRSNISIHDLWLSGEGVYVGTGASTVGAVNISALTVAVANISIKRCGFDNFKSDYWIMGGSGPELFPVSGITFSENTLNTKPADTPPINAAGDGGGVAFAAYGQAGAVCTYTEANDNVINGTGLAIGIALFHAHSNFKIARNQINDMGGQVSAARNSYAILCYGNAGNDGPTIGTIESNQVVKCQSAGIYCVAGTQIVLANNYIESQRRTDDATLPRAGIVLSNVDGVTVSGGNINNCWGGVAIVGNAALAGVLVSGVKIRCFAGLTNVYGMRIGLMSAAAYSRVVLVGNDIYLPLAGAVGFRLDGAVVGSLVARENQVRAGSNGLTNQQTANLDIANQFWNFP